MKEYGSNFIFIDDDYLTLARLADPPSPLTEARSAGDDGVEEFPVIRVKRFFRTMPFTQRFFLPRSEADVFPS